MADPERTVTVITDSTSDIPADLVRELNIVVVPLNITFGSESFRDGIDLSTDQFIDMLIHSDALPTTSQPSAGEFAAAFQGELDQGRDVVCVTIGAFLSGTHNAASIAAGKAGADRIAVIDGGSTTMQMGWVAVEAARAANTGAGMSTVRTIAEQAVGRTNLFAVLKTLDYVYKGGRIGKASQLVGSALGIKPILAFRDGTLVPLERVRTWSKALKRIVQLVNDQGDLSDIMVLYNDNRSDAEAVLEEITQQHPNANILLGHAGAVISTHAGPGAIGIATLRRS